MPGSQLSQLKAALTTAGLDRKSSSKKDKKAFKKGGARETDRAKKFQRLEDIRRGLNKFDERETKLKHDTGGRNLKGVKGRPSASRQAGLEQRKKSLLPEHQLRGHSGTFKDRRFGESDPSLSFEDRMLERYTRERQRGQGKKGLFNLEDDEDVLDGFDEGTALGGLTHGGRSVMDLPGDDFETQGLGEDEETDHGIIGRRQVSSGHFGGFGAESRGDEESVQTERIKSKAEVMSEVIAKSKGHKYERQQQKELDIDLRDELDENLDGLRTLLQADAPDIAGPSRLSVPKLEDADVDYDQVVRTLAFDARAKPKNRTRTEEEIAVEEKERLEMAEAERLRRMRGEVSDEEHEGGSRNRRRTGGRRPDGDDLDDDFIEEENDLLGPQLTRQDLESMRLPNEKEDEEYETPEENAESDEEDEQDSDEEDGTETGEGDEESEASKMDDLLGNPSSEKVRGTEEFENNLACTPKRKARDRPKVPKKELPYTFPCPSSIEDFENILEGLEDSALSTVVQRIRSLHHPSLAQGNKEKLQDFLPVLLDYTLILASRPPPAFDIISTILPHLTALVRLNPLTAAAHFIAKLSLMQKNLMRGLALGASTKDSKTFPGCPELVLLRLIGVVWSTSDFSHPVVAPAVLLMCQYLGQSRIRTVSDLASGLFLCSLLAQYETLSKRLLPEAINFVSSSVLVLLPRRKGRSMSSAFPDLQAPDVEFSTSSIPPMTPREPVDLPAVINSRNMSFSKAEIEQQTTDLLAVAERLIETFATMSASSPAFVELLSPVLSVLDGSKTGKLSPALKDLHSSTTSNLSRMLEHARSFRRPLAMQAHKPVPIASYAPKFEDDFAPGRHYDPDSERNSSAKVRALYKKERKGAIRELRKDNRFLAGEKAREQRDKDSAYDTRMRRVEGEINSERAEEKAMQREKAREKRRAGHGRK